MYALIALAWLGDCSVGIELPTLEVRFQKLTADADCYLGNRALPTLWNATRNFFEVLSLEELSQFESFRTNELHLPTRFKDDG